MPDRSTGQDDPAGGARLLHIFGSFDHGGAEARTIGLMARLGPDLHHTVLVGDPKAIGARVQAELLGNVRFDDQASTLVLGRPGLSRLHRLAATMREYDLVLTYAWGAMDAVAAHRLWGKTLHLPSLIHHDDGFSEEESWLRIYYRRFGLHGCHRLVVPSRTLERIALSDWKMPAARIARIPNGIDVTACQSANHRVFPGLENEQRLVVGTVAGLRPEKNLCRLVRAVAGAGPNVVLVVAGEGPDRGRIMAEAERLGMAERVLMPGFIANPGQYLRSFDLFALSSDTEQFPISLAEAMAAGLPVVATDVGDIRDMVAPENRKFLAPLGKEACLATAIRTLLADPSLRKRIGAANAARAETHFGEDEMIRSYSELYRSAISRAK